ncbi:hypothetical protein B9J88_04245 [Vibrio sp. V05_P4A8T149]|nr:hypothetical protein B9J88_04245 [Vibrio sp. V05_P4A8T149]OXX30396.1 hypothetical protein B9J81_16025 [Vibrio sp. V04_P4A5T148]OXX31296.1 hypothetical protein B9J95_09530 [Vibrio sp. V14_P6S14T42]OXX51490.1 hypothetical protein B9J91_16940 [Vibrio sp. V18_P1S4T112]
MANTLHKHSKLNHVTPAQPHNGKDKEILANREEGLLASSGDIRSCEPFNGVHLNQEREAA